VARDHTGGVVATQCSTRPYICDLVVAEAMSMWTMAALVGQLGFMDVILEGDSLEVVQAIKREESQGTRYGLLLEETKELL
jgi:hypothetical protein